MCHSAPKFGPLSDTDIVMFAGGQRKRRAAPVQRRQAVGAEEEEEDVEAEFNPDNPYQVSHTHKPALLLSFTSRLCVSACPFRSEGYLGRFRRRRVSHSSASGSRCRGHVAGSRIVTANLGL